MDPAAAGPLPENRIGYVSIQICAFLASGSCRQPPDRSRSPQPTLIKDENAPLASGTPSRRAGIQLRRAQQQMAVRPQATSDRLRALPVRVAWPLMHGRLPDASPPGRRCPSIIPFQKIVRHAEKHFRPFAEGAQSLPRFFGQSLGDSAGSIQPDDCGEGRLFGGDIFPGTFSELF
jgi:hypothetical protein